MIVHTPTVKILRMRAVTAKLGIARSTIYDWLDPKSPRYDATFPKQRRLGQQSVGWVEAELDQWRALLNKSNFC
jgi:prophage regulatory protein